MEKEFLKLQEAHEGQQALLQKMQVLKWIHTDNQIKLTLTAPSFSCQAFLNVQRAAIFVIYQTYLDCRELRGRCEAEEWN